VGYHRWLDPLGAGLVRVDGNSHRLRPAERSRFLVLCNRHRFNSWPGGAWFAFVFDERESVTSTCACMCMRRAHIASTPGAPPCASIICSPSASITRPLIICCRALRDCPRGQLLQSPTRWFGNRRRRAARVCRGGVRAPGLPVYTRHFNLMLARRRFSPNFRLGCGGGKNQQEFANSFHPYFTLKAKSGHIGLGCSKTAEIILFSTYL
jgi:hypothetical protein